MPAIRTPAPAPPSRSARSASATASPTAPASSPAASSSASPSPAPSPPRPRLLLADEPTGNLDAATGTTVMDLLFDLRATHGTTLLLITHDAALAARCPRQIRIADGRVTSAV